ATHGYFREIMRGMLHDPYGRDLLVTAAKAGCAEPIAILRDVLIRSKSEKIALPTELEEYDLWKEKRGGEVRLQRHTGKMDEFTGNIVICLTLGAARYNFPSISFYGGSARSPSILQLIGREVFGLSYERTKTVWIKYSRAVVPGTPEGQKSLFENP